jgi:hypothetical protein
MIEDESDDTVRLKIREYYKSLYGERLDAGSELDFYQGVPTAQDAKSGDKKGMEL